MRPNAVLKLHFGSNKNNDQVEESWVNLILNWEYKHGVINV